MPILQIRPTEMKQIPKSQLGSPWKSQNLFQPLNYYTISPNLIMIKPRGRIFLVIVALFVHIRTVANVS